MRAAVCVRDRVCVCACVRPAAVGVAGGATRGVRVSAAVWPRARACMHPHDEKDVRAHSRAPSFDDAASATHESKRGGTHNNNATKKESQTRPQQLGLGRERHDLGADDRRARVQRHHVAHGRRVAALHRHK